MIDKPSLWNHKNSPDPCLLVEELTNVVGNNDVHDVDVVIRCIVVFDLLRKKRRNPLESNLAIRGI